MKRASLLSMGMLLSISIISQTVHNDCADAILLCTNETVAFEKLIGPGIDDGLSSLSCLSDDFPETNSVWFKWEVGVSGSLGFTIVPLDESDDLDFVLFKLDGDIGDCDQRHELRCMVSGKNRGGLNNTSSEQCTGATGLNGQSSDTQENTGCADADDNFLSEIEVSAGENYALFINNYHSDGGFLMEFTGTAGFADLGGICTDRPSGADPVSLGQLDGSKVSIGAPYPNPAKDELFLPIISEDTFDDVRIQVINSQGELAWQAVTGITVGEQSYVLPLGSLARGIYFLKTTVGESQHIVRFYKH